MGAIIAFAHAIPLHAVENDLARAPLRRLARPADRFAPGIAARRLAAGILLDAVATRIVAETVDAKHDALAAEIAREGVDQVGIGERGRVDRELVGARIKRGGSGVACRDSPRDGERDIDHARDAFDPGKIDGAAFGARGDVVEDELVGAIVAVKERVVDDIADVAVVGKLDALDHAPGAHVEAGDDPKGGHGRSPP